MKYFFLLSIAVIGFTSCKKDYTCSCKDANGTPNDISYHSTKRRAESKCKYYGEVYAGTGITCTVNK